LHLPAPLAEETKGAQTHAIMHLTEMPPPPKSYRRTTMTKAQREELLRELQRRYRERKHHDSLSNKTKKRSNQENLTEQA
jgi:hypothetical protein